MRKIGISLQFALAEKQPRFSQARGRVLVVLHVHLHLHLPAKPSSRSPHPVEDVDREDRGDHGLGNPPHGGQEGNRFRCGPTPAASGTR